MIATSGLLLLALAAIGALALRLLLLARRSGGLPERLIGSFFALFAGMLLVRTAGSLVPGWGDAATVVGHASWR